jgi:MoxR-like ATPase
MNKHSQFQGEYIRDIAHFLIASAVSRQNAVMVSEPGWGKTAIARALGKEIAGDNTVFIRLEGSTPPEEVKGSYDPAKYIDEGKLEPIVKGTPFDPNAFIVIADEIFRPNEVVFDLMLEVLDRQSTSPDDAPVVWGTSNFVAEGERIEAVLDRIALWLWLQPERLDVKSFISGIFRRKKGEQLGIPTNSVPTPSIEKILEVRSFVPETSTAETIANLLDVLAQEARRENFKISPRRLTQWFELVYRTSAFILDEPDFDTVPTQAAIILRWAYPTLSHQEWAKWAKVSSAVADPVGTAIDAVLREAFEAFDEAEVGSYQSKSDKSMVLGEILSRSMRSLKALKINDPRIEEAQESLSKRFTRIVHEN